MRTYEIDIGDYESVFCNNFIEGKPVLTFAEAEEIAGRKLRPYEEYYEIYNMGGTISKDELHDIGMGIRVTKRGVMEEYAGERDRLEEELNDSLWIEDSVTGNASGSYTFDRNRAKEYVLADMDTVTEALREFCTEAETIAEKFLSEDWEYFDVTARCYILNSAIYEALEELESEGAFEAEADETAESAISAAAATMNGMMEGFEKTFQKSAENATGAVTA